MGGPRASLLVAAVLLAAAPASAQRVPFERSFAATADSILEVSTIRGAIDVSAGEPGRIVVTGTVTVRIGIDVPANAVDIAHEVAANPPFTKHENTLELRPPSGGAGLRAVTVSYEVRVPPGTSVRTSSDSGATTIRGVVGPVQVHTQSGAIALSGIGGVTTVTTGSGAIEIDGVAGGLTGSTASSAFRARRLGGDLQFRTESGAVDASFSGAGDVDVQTGSSAIHLEGLRGGLVTSTRSGRVVVQGTPARPWTITTGSGSVDVALEPGAPAMIDGESGSGSVTVTHPAFQGSATKRHATGSIGGAGAAVKVTSRSAAIRVTEGRADP